MVALITAVFREHIDNCTWKENKDKNANYLEYKQAIDCVKRAISVTAHRRISSLGTHFVFVYVHVMPIFCMDTTGCYRIFTSPHQVTYKLQSMGAMALNFQYGDGLDFHCILYQAKCVGNLIICFSVVHMPKAIGTRPEMDCVSRHR